MNTIEIHDDEEPGAQAPAPPPQDWYASVRPLWSDKASRCPLGREACRCALPCYLTRR